MKKFRCSFVGRLIGSQGVCYQIICFIEAETIEQANLKLYNTYEHITQFRASEVKINEVIS